MGVYLSMLGNRKPNAAKNIRPDENYARELMQLFTIGLYLLALASASSSSSSSTSALGKNVIRSGMQYWHLRSQRSVTDRRK
jgi:uncharacterized protein (DUF1800 family)